MPLIAENLSRRIFRDLAIYTRGKVSHWVSIETVERMMVLDNMFVVEAALKLARAKGWLEIEAGHSIHLTDEGRRLAEG